MFIFSCSCGLCLHYFFPVFNPERVAVYRCLKVFCPLYVVSNLRKRPKAGRKRERGEQGTELILLSSAWLLYVEDALDGQILQEMLCSNLISDHAGKGKLEQVMLARGLLSTVLVLMWPTFQLRLPSMLLAFCLISVTVQCGHLLALTDPAFLYVWQSRNN